MSAASDRRITLFLCGDVMTGRGIDQVLPHPGDPRLHEPWARSAKRYVELAEESSGAIARPMPPSAIWGDALAELDRVRPDVRIANLETAVTAAGEPWPRKSIHYRMHPANVSCLTAAALDVCSLANNHVLDWGARGLADTLATLRAAGIATAGGGANADEARAPALVERGGVRRVVVFAFGLGTSGIPETWAAENGRPGVWRLPDLSDRSAQAVIAGVHRARRPDDVVVASIHWGANWDYAIAAEERGFARRLIEAGVDIVHGHSSHHPKGIEIYRGRPILYGCGDLVNDYEGIHGYEPFRGELGFLYFATFGAAGALDALRLVPTRMRGLQVRRAGEDDARWLGAMLARECRPLGTRVDRVADGSLRVARA